jgi:hypothetical protein
MSGTCKHTRLVSLSSAKARIAWSRHTEVWTDGVFSLFLVFGVGLYGQ